jgi:amidohydrolase
MPGRYFHDSSLMAMEVRSMMWNQNPTLARRALQPRPILPCRCRQTGLGFVKISGRLQTGRDAMDGFIFRSRCAQLIPIAALMFLQCDKTSLADGIDGDVQPFLPVVMQAYDYLHRNPELGKQEFKAHKYIEAQLRQLGYSQLIASKSVPTAVIAVLDTGRPGPVIALRAEMDARPLPSGQNEPPAHSPHSELAGLMHNCGHDAHAAILLGTAASLLHNVGKLRGKVVFLFQPAEETPGGADDIVNEHLLDDLGVTKIYAEHSAPGVPVGTITISSGPTMAGSNYFTLELNGRSSHAAAPHESDDVLLSAAKIAEEISYAPARRFEIAARPLVISITKMVADGGASNVLPSRATLNGTIRAFEDPKIAPRAVSRLKRFSSDWWMGSRRPMALLPTGTFGTVRRPLSITRAYSMRRYDLSQPPSQERSTPHRTRECTPRILPITRLTTRLCTSPWASPKMASDRPVFIPKSSRSIRMPLGMA